MDFSIIIMLTQPFVPTCQGIMKDHYSTDQNQIEVNSFRVSVHYTFRFKSLHQIRMNFSCKNSTVALWKRKRVTILSLAGEFFLVFRLLSGLFIVWYTQHQREFLPGFLEWITCSKEHNSLSNRYSGAEVMWDSNFLYIPGFSTTIRTKKFRHADNSGTERSQDREMGIGIFCYANTLEAWIYWVFKDVASII